MRLFGVRLLCVEKRRKDIDYMVFENMVISALVQNPSLKRQFFGNEQFALTLLEKMCTKPG